MIFSNFLSFSLISLIMVLTPGPNMIYLISRSISQGKKAGLISLLGVGSGFFFYMILASLGITAVLFKLPYLYNTIKILGALYLLWLAWNALKPKGHSPFEVHNLHHDSNLKLFSMGFITNLLNPKIALMYLALLPQFIDVHYSTFLQSIYLGLVQISISLSVNALIVISASSIAIFLQKNYFWAKAQKYFMGIVLLSLALKILTGT